MGLEVHANMKEERLAEAAKSATPAPTTSWHPSATARCQRCRWRAGWRRSASKPAEELAAVPAKPSVRSYRGVVVRGIDNVLVRFAKCCTPVPGDPIVGYITRGRGVSVHTEDCPNASQILRADPGRTIEVWWDTRERSSYPVDIEMEALDRPGLLTVVMNAVAETKATVSAVTARTSKTHRPDSHDGGDRRRGPHEQRHIEAATGERSEGRAPGAAKLRGVSAESRGAAGEPR